MPPIRCSTASSPYDSSCAVWYNVHMLIIPSASQLYTLRSVHPVCMYVHPVCPSCLYIYLSCLFDQFCLYVHPVCLSILPVCPPGWQRPLFCRQWPCTMCVTPAPRWHSCSSFWRRTSSSTWKTAITYSVSTTSRWAPGKMLHWFWFVGFDRLLAFHMVSAIPRKVWNSLLARASVWLANTSTRDYIGTKKKYIWKAIAV